MEQEFDIIIVGAGPSAAGLLYGILNRIILDRDSSGGDDGNKSSSSNLSHVRIAVLERGNSVDLTNNSTCATDAGTPQFEHCHASTYHLQNWFQTAHYIPSSKTTTQHPTILHTTTPQSHLCNRIIDVPTGTGWGGGTNINAGLIVQPNTEHDFENWPGRWKSSGWKGDGLIDNAMDEILVHMMNNEGLTSTSIDVDARSNILGIEERYLDGSSDENCSNFLQPSLSSNTNNRRVNYFTSLIAPLLKRHPELYSNVTFLSGVKVERILIRYSCSAAGDEDDFTKQTQQHVCKPHAWAVECDYGDYRGIIQSKRDIILCCGAIATPSLLLASGIGTEDDLRTADIAPWYEHTKCDIHNDDSALVKNNVHRNLPVGHNLRDHIVLPRVFLTPHPRNPGAESQNSIIGWWLTQVPTSSSTDAKMQLQLADGIQMDYMIPHFAAGALRRRWVLPFAVHLPLAWIQSIFVGVRAVLRLFFCIPVLSKWVKLHFASLNLCLMNPKSVGRVTVRSSKGLQSCTRLSDCKVIIDPNYLSDSCDVESLWRGWSFSSRMKQRLFKRGIEILPGYTFSAGFAACSLISSALHWMKALLGGKLHDDHNESQFGGNVPPWFRKYAAEFSNPYYHWCGTCAMGEEPEDDSTSATTRNGESVVDEHLSVHGLSNLRICDASVFPDSVSAPPALTCAALGYAASSFIIE
eukprot:scaffold318_cov96-Skeletonema_dohrnii-CCMP3373.AAC.3